MNRKRARNILVKWLPLDLTELNNKRIDLPRDQVASYIFLVARFWIDAAPLPDNDKQLAKIANMSVRLFRNHKHTLLADFELTDSGWIHPKYQAEQQKSEHIRQQRSKAAKVRWDASAMQMHGKEVSICNASTEQNRTEQILPVKQPPAAAPDLQPTGNKIRGGAK